SAAQSWQNLNSLINRVECLRNARGHVLERNSCRMPWSSRVDLKFQQNLSLMGRTAQFTADVINLGNLLNPEWGRQYFIANQSDLLLSTSGNTVDANGHRTYAAFNPRVSPFGISDLDS